ncbi:MAG: DinB family protein, partial [Actinomycetota bacterium]
GWVWDTWPDELGTRETWARALEASMEDTHARLGGNSERLNAKVEQIDNPGRTVSGWRVLMMMAEHEIAHRAQIGAYAGLNGWPVAQIFDRTNEWVRARRDDQFRRYRS